MTSGLSWLARHSGDLEMPPGLLLIVFFALIPLSLAVRLAGSARGWGVSSIWFMKRMYVWIDPEVNDN